MPWSRISNAGVAGGWAGQLHRDLNERKEKAHKQQGRRVSDGGTCKGKGAKVRTYLTIMKKKSKLGISQVGNTNKDIQEKYFDR